MTDLRDLYQEIILDHTKRPRNCRILPDANRRAEGHNRLCGDHMTLFLKVQNGVVIDISFQGSGCAISTASASIMTEALKGKRIEEVKEVFKRFHELVTAGPDDEVNAEDLGKLAAFAGVREFPVRVKCATLAWHTLKAALENEKQPATTE
jgi:nitrogen fixation NifU-like protein